MIKSEIFFVSIHLHWLWIKLFAPSWMPNCGATPWLAIGIIVGSKRARPFVGIWVTKFYSVFCWSCLQVRVSWHVDVCFNMVALFYPPMCVNKWRTTIDLCLHVAFISATAKSLHWSSPLILLLSTKDKKGTNNVLEYNLIWYKQITAANININIELN